MAQLDDIVGAVMKKLKDMGLDDNTIVVFTTDNGTENFTWPDGGQTPFAGGKGTVLEGGFRVPASCAGRARCRPARSRTASVSGLDWFPTFVAAAGNPNIVEELKKGKQLGDRTYKVHLDGYNQMDLITGKGPSKRHEIFYFTEGTLSARAHRRLQVPLHRSAERLARRHGQGRLADPDQPPPRSLRAHGHAERRQRLARLLQLVRLRVLALRLRAAGGGASSPRPLIEFPPMQKGASFNLEAVKEQIEKAIAAQTAK